MNIKSNLMWMGVGIYVGSMMSKYKKQVDQVMDDISTKATKKVRKMVDNM